jgi:hypothetical protein
VPKGIDEDTVEGWRGKVRVKCVSHRWCLAEADHILLRLARRDSLVLRLRASARHAWTRTIFLLGHSWRSAVGMRAWGSLRACTRETARCGMFMWQRGGASWDHLTPPTWYLAGPMSERVVKPVAPRPRPVRGVTSTRLVRREEEGGARERSSKSTLYERLGGGIHGHLEHNWSGPAPRGRASSG